MKKRFFKTKKFIFGVVILALASGGALAYRHYKAKKELKKLEELSPVKVSKGLFVIKTQAIGVVEPENRVLVTPSVNGRAEEILFREGDLMKKGQILAWISSSERTALLDSLKMKDSTPEEKKMVEEAYNLTPVVSPIDGMVVKRAVEPGQSVSAGKEIAVISDRLIIKTFVDETDIGSVKEGQKAEFYLDSFPKDRHEGNVLSIARESISREGVTVYEVKILSAKNIPVLRSGMTADVRVITAVKPKALSLPKKAIAYKDGDAFVTIKDEKSKKVTDKKVEVGAANEKAIEIISGLGENDVVYYSTGIAKERMTVQIN
ncbi:MAG: HlyD family efflux transporter periplasmic adaptor subunit [Elusimicrobia bacterium]|nr:HlyD family efflux transporter periplasmic adaptor subunit [Elusimicrobiota bacterium]